MAKKKTQTVVVTEPDIEEAEVSGVLDEVEDEMEESLALDLQAVLAELGDTGQLTVQLIKTHPKEEAGVCSTYSGAELSLDRVREEFGAGKYKLLVRGPTGRIATRKQVSIVAKKVPQGPNVTELADLLKKQQSGEGSNNTLLLMKMLEMQSQTMIAAMNRPLPPVHTPPSFGPAEMVTMMTGLASIMKPSSVESPIDAMLKGVDLVRKIRGDDDGGGDSVVSVVSKGLDMAASMLNGAQNSTPAPPASRTVSARVIDTPTAIAPASTEPAEPAPPDVLAVKLAWLKEWTRRLVDKARADRDPELYADVFLDELPEFVTATDLDGALRDAGWLTQLTLMNPNVADHSEWFAHFRGCVVERLDEAAELSRAAAENTDANVTA